MKVGILGATGYTGQELVRLLEQHPEAQIEFLGSSSSAGKPIMKCFLSLWEHLWEN